MVALRNAVVRLGRAWRALAPDQRLAGGAALGLLATMVLPWYQETGTAFRRGQAPENLSRNLNAFQAYSFVEAAIFLVALGVLLLLFARAERRAFHLPGGDGTVVTAAGAWAMLLLFYRQLDKPGGRHNGVYNTYVGVQWGIFIAFLVAGGLTYAGYRLRSAALREPTAAQDPTARVEPTPPPTAATVAVPSRPRARRGTAGPEAPTRLAGQLSFEEEHDPRDSGDR